MIVMANFPVIPKYADIGAKSNDIHQLLSTMKWVNILDLLGLVLIDITLQLSTVIQIRVMYICAPI